MITKKQNMKAPHIFIGDELLIAGLKNFPKGEPYHFKDDIACAFYKASKNPIYEQLFQKYTFDTTGPIPGCTEIEKGITILRQKQLLIINSHYTLSKGIDIEFKEFITPKMNKEQKELIEQLSLEIKEYLLS